MRQLILIALLVGVLIYIPVTLQVAPASAEHAYTDQTRPSIAMLEQALAATGARLEGVTLNGWAAGTGADAVRLRERLGPQAKVSLVGEHVSVAWRPGPERWSQAFYRMHDALGRQARISVQLEGRATGGEPEILVGRAMDALKATGKQPWVTPTAASTAAFSRLLPPHEVGVNVQAAARLDRNGVRVWVGWPVLNQEY